MTTEANDERDQGDRIAALARAVAGLAAALERIEAKLDALAGMPAEWPKDPAPAATPPAKPVAPKPAAAPALAEPKRGIPGDAPIRLMIAGARSHGRKHIDAYLGLDGCRIDVVCDVDTNVGAEAIAHIEAASGHRPRYVRDFREAVADPAIDAVSIATPHHWHALQAIWALQAGKHVYIEKPLSHDIREGESVVAAARKYGKVVQFGTQLRSNGSLRTAAAAIREGRIGDVEVVHCLVYKPRPAVPPTNENRVPATVDYDLWCGPGPLASVARSKFHYHWHWTWDFGNGALGNNGIHRVDVARIGMGDLLPGLGDRVLSFGGRFGGADAGETPNVQVAVHRFGRRWVVQEVFGLPVKPWRGVSNGIIFHGSEGTITYQAGGAALTDEKGGVIERFEGKQTSHYRNFLNAIRANDPSKVNGSVEEGHLSSALCHLANISYRLGRPTGDEAIAARLAEMGAPRLVSDTLTRVRTNLRKLDETEPMVLGDTLALSGGGTAEGPIVDNERATALLGGSRREPYDIPTPAEV